MQRLVITRTSTYRIANPKVILAHYPRMLFSTDGKEKQQPIWDDIQTEATKAGMQAFTVGVETAQAFRELYFS